MSGRNRDFLFGVIYAAWFLQHSHGMDSLAEELMRTCGPLDTLQRLAREEDYRFKRGFWAELKRQQRINRIT